MKPTYVVLIACITGIIGTGIGLIIGTKIFSPLGFGSGEFMAFVLPQKRENNLAYLRKLTRINSSNKLRIRQEQILIYNLNKLKN